MKFQSIKNQTGIWELFLYNSNESHPIKVADLISKEEPSPERWAEDLKMEAIVRGIWAKNISENGVNNEF